MAKCRIYNYEVKENDLHVCNKKLCNVSDVLENFDVDGNIEEHIKKYKL